MKSKATQAKIKNRKSKKGTVKDLDVKGVRGGSVKGGQFAKIEISYKNK